MRTAPVLLICGLSGAAQLFSQQTDAVIDAMKAEMNRTLTLSLGQLDKPYYVAYAVDDARVWSTTATLGSILTTNFSTFRTPLVRLRVGDYKFDNSNFAGGNGGGARYNLGAFPLEDDAPTIRRYFWLATDSAYKGALQTIARKRSALRSVTVSEQLPDFSPAPAFTFFKTRAALSFDHKAWETRIRNVSAAFAAYPTLRTSLVEMTAIDGLHRFVNSEGTVIRQPQELGYIQIRASAQASDGMIVRDFQGFYSATVAGMDSESTLTAAAKSLGDQIVKLAAAPMGDNYSGPVLFEGVAAPQLMSQVLGRNLHIARKAVGTSGQGSATELEGRRGVRIMPEFFNVVDDPAAPGFGHAEIDDEGMPTTKVSLVEKGILKDFLRNRTPVRGFTESNGHGMLPGLPLPTNLIITATEKTPVADMKQKMIDLIQQRGLDFGIVIRKLDLPSSAPLDEARRLIAGGGSSGAQPISIPLYAFKVFPDGHEQMIRGVRLRGINARTLKDILMAGDDSVSFNYLDNGAPYALLAGGGNSSEVSVISPSLLIDDLELSKMDEELPKLPIAPSPLTSGQ
jgi:hypothetical protein